MMNITVSNWNTDITKAPHGRYEVRERRTAKGIAVHKPFKPEYIWAASKCGIVTLTRYLPVELPHRKKPRWEMFGEGEIPVAWRAIEPGDSYEGVNRQTGKPVTKYRIPEHPFPEMVRPAEERLAFLRSVTKGAV